MRVQVVLESSSIKKFSDLPISQKTLAGMERDYPYPAFYYCLFSQLSISPSFFPLCVSLSPYLYLLFSNLIYYLLVNYFH